MSNYHEVSLYSGGGGLVSSAMDYMKFAEAMRNGGELNGNRILSEKTVKYMAKNHLPGSMSSGGTGEFPLLGQQQRGFGFGLGFGVVTDPVKSAVMGSVGEFNWGGAAGTVFWIDPVAYLFPGSIAFFSGGSMLSRQSSAAWVDTDTATSLPHAGPPPSVTAGRPCDKGDGRRAVVGRVLLRRCDAGDLKVDCARSGEGETQLERHPAPDAQAPKKLPLDVCPVRKDSVAFAVPLDEAIARLDSLYVP